ncbi:MAG: hypothetical protein DRM98_00560 [Thermoplasmata archaeon]|nr:MAG: hypothetical protein DRM98_00560 [Thermoplasmata archaeon]
MRKRAQRRFKPQIEETRRHTIERDRTTAEKKPLRFKKNWWIPLALIAIFLLVLFYNSYFNITSDIAINPEGKGLEKYYLSGPDPYYNLRLIKGTYETGRYPYYSENDPLLNYPLGATGGRPPLFNMMALGFSRLLTPFMSELDAIGRAMQFLPALYGALIVFPVYFIGRILFNKKAGLIAAMFIPLIPIHLGSGHGSAYSLFDHDSFNLLLYFSTFLFLILSIKEKKPVKSILYAILGGVPLAALSMTWFAAHFLYVVIGVYAVVQMIFDIFTNKIEFKIFRSTSIILLTGYLISLPVLSARPSGFTFSLPFFICIGVIVFGIIYYLFGRLRIPWTLSLPIVFSVGGVALALLYFINVLAKSFPFLSPLKRLSTILFGSGIYGSKVSGTIAEANTYGISRTVMSFGPTLYWLGWAGFVLLLWYYYKDKRRRDYLFLIILFVVDVWLTGTAGRFLNDMVPLIAILGGWVTWIVVSKLDFKQMLRNIKSAGGGFHGIRRGVKILHIVGILFITFLVILPNVFIALDAAVPNKVYQKEDGNWSNLKWDMFGENYVGVFGLGVGKEAYWCNALDWLREHDTDIPKSEDRPAFISWWDYGFYEVALGGHPTVADNFQDGIPPAANFHTAIGEKEATIVFIIRLLEGDMKDNNGKISEDVKKAFNKYLSKNDTKTLVGWLENPTTSPSYGTPIGEMYDKNLSKEHPVGEQYSINAVYHDVIDFLTNGENYSLSDEEITWLYHDIQNITGYSIRYYGVEGYDMQIFNIFAYLADKSLLLAGAPEDDFIKIYYVGYKTDSTGKNIIERNLHFTSDELKSMDIGERRYIHITGTDQVFKDPYFDTMFYRTYIGYNETDQQGKKTIPKRGHIQLPCLGMKHFYGEFISDLTKYPYYNTGRAAVVIAKYYEGAYVNGTVLFKNVPINNSEVVVQKNLSYTGNFTVPIDHDSYKIVSDENPEGRFNLLAGAGCRLQVRRNLGLGSFTLKNVTFNGVNGSDYAPITDDDAMRRPDSNYERFLNITIDPANVTGYVFVDKDDDNVFNSSVDQPLFSNVLLRMSEITKFTRDERGNERVEFGNYYSLPIDKNGSYEKTGLLPGYYRLVLYDNNSFILSLVDSAFYSGNTSLNISKCKTAGLEGIVYYDENSDNKYNPGEEVKKAKVTLYHVFRDENGNVIQESPVANTTTKDDGSYSFKSIVPGKINGMNLNEYSIKVEKTPVYQSVKEGVYPEENKTMTYNISMGLTPVKVSGNTTFNGNPVDNVLVEFTPDETVENNTAEKKQVYSDETGSYSVELQPGSYNITVSKKEGTGYPRTLVYEVTDKIVLTKGEGSVTKDFSLVKKSVTVTGLTKYEDQAIGNVSISFKKDSSVENNTAVSNEAMSDENGSYTVELAPGTYNVTTTGEQFNISGVNYTYEGYGTLTVTEDDITTGVTYNVELFMKEIE